MDTAKIAGVVAIAGMSVTLDALAALVADGRMMTVEAAQTTDVVGTRWDCGEFLGHGHVCATKED